MKLSEKLRISGIFCFSVINIVLGGISLNLVFPLHPIRMKSICKWLKNCLFFPSPIAKDRFN